MPKVLISAMLKWYLHETARAFENSGSLAGYWVSNANITSVDSSRYSRIWPYHLLKKPFYHLPFTNLDEWTRWLFLPAYDAWVESRSIPDDCDVVMGPMGACTPLFGLTRKSKRPILKVFDAPNSHPRTYARLWQDECDTFAPGYRIPFPKWAVERISKEIASADLIVCPSEFVKESMLENGVSAERCFVRHFGVDTTTFRQRVGLPESPVFVSVGSICLRKGHQYLFPAFRRLKESRPDARLICIGGVRPDFKREWAKWGNTIEHHPFLEHRQIAGILQGASAFVLASVEEGFARVLCEAMAAGLPVIATHATGITTVARDGEAALVVPPRDVDSLFEALLRLAENPSLNERMGRNAYRIGTGRNTWQDYGDSLLDRFRTELKGRERS